MFRIKLPEGEKGRSNPERQNRAGYNYRQRRKKEKVEGSGRRGGVREREREINKIQGLSS